MIYDPEHMTDEQRKAVAKWLHPRFGWDRHVALRPVRVLGPLALYFVYVTDRYGRIKIRGTRAVICPLITWVGRTRPSIREG